MEQLYKILKEYSLNEILKIEKSDRQFIAVNKLYEEKNFKNKIYFQLVILNALICYQLSGNGEDYWEEFYKYTKDKDVNTLQQVKEVLIIFLTNSKNNKRLVNIKIKRIDKFIDNYSMLNNKAFEFYYKNMDIFALDLSKVMKQKKDAKTIVFAVKMFSYSARNVFNYNEIFPTSLGIPIDSRLIKIYKKFNKNSKVNIKDFYKTISFKLNVPELHLDTILWNIISKEHL